jgi:hypothetical protein
VLDLGISALGHSRTGWVELTETDPFSWIRAAATGDLAAQRAMSAIAVEMVSTRLDLDPQLVLAEGLVFARLAEAHGDRTDAVRLTEMLPLAAEFEAGAGNEDNEASLIGELIARIDLLADQGVPNASEEVSRITERGTAQIMANAKEYRERLLPEGDHATFPGWYGAPVLGGARSAGLRNPMARN